LRSLVERIHRTIAGADRWKASPPTFSFYHGFGDGDELAHRIVPALDHDAEAIDCQ
jgi:hypothetical protein